MLSWMRKIYARVILTYLFCRQLSRRILLFWRRRKGLTTFLEQYAPDYAFATGKLERELLPQFQKCLNCSLCSFSCSALKEGRGPAGFEPKYLPLSAVRSAHESEIFIEDWLPCLDCPDCTVACPNDVPIRAIANTIIARRNRLGFRSGALVPTLS